MAINKIINVNDGSGREFTENTVAELKFDMKPEVGSFNAVTSDAVARAVAGASGEVPEVTESDNGKVLKAVYDEGGPAVEWGDAGSGVPEYSGSDEGKVLGVVTEGVEETPALAWVASATVDQTYDPSSANAQSGVAVSEAVSGINAPPVPSVSDEGKTLSVVVYGDTPSMEWTEPQGGSSYTAGDGISIENDTVSAVVNDGSGLMLSGPTVRGTYVYANNCVVFNVGDSPDPDAEAFISLDVGIGVQVYFIGNRDAAYPVLVLYSTTDSSSYAVCSRSFYGAMEMNGPSYVYALNAGNYTMRGRMSDLFGNNWTDLVDSDGNINMCLCATDTLDGTTLWGTGTGPGGSASAYSFGSNSCPVEITSSIVGKVGISLFDVPIPTDTIRFKFASATTDPTTDSDLNTLAGTWTRISHTPNVWDYTERTTSLSSRFNQKFTANGINVDILGANLLTPTNLSSLFYRCTGILSVANFKVGPTVNASSMFYQCENVATVGINMGVSNASSMFNKCYNLTDVTGAINFRTPGSAASMCESCSNLKAITWGISNITSLASAFKGCSHLKEIPPTGWGGSNFTRAFEDCTGLTTIPYINMNSASSGADMSSMFKGCTGLMYLGTLYGGGATNFTSAFEGCTGLLTLPTISATPTNVSSMFKGCTRVLGGAPQVYQQFASQATPPSTTTDCFTNCGSGTTVGTADLAQIPSSWGGTGA